MSNSFSPSPSQILGWRSLISEAMPVCQVCGLPTDGHGFRRVGSTPLWPGRPQSAAAILEAVETENWNQLDEFQESHGSITSVEVIHLRCLDGRHSLAALVCPSSLDEPYFVLRQKQVEASLASLQPPFWGEI